MKEELLFGLTPQEGWVWNYLELLAQRQGSTHIILPRPGEDLKAEKVFCRRHLKRLLMALKVKRHLTNLIIPRSKSKQIEVFLPASMIADLEVRNNNLHDQGVRNKRAMMTPVSAITTLRTCTSAIEQAISATLPESTPSQAKLKDSLKALISKKQGDLIREILGFREGQVAEMRRSLRVFCGIEAKGRDLSQHARLYATIRYLQEAGNIEKHQPWMTTVARRGQEDMDRWNGGRSGSVGKSPSRERSASG